MENFAQINIDDLPYFAHRHAIELIMRRLHGALRCHGQGRVGISFTYYHKADFGGDSTLGNIINLVSHDVATLETVVRHLDLTKILNVDAIHLTGIMTTPADLPRATFRRRRNEERRRVNSGRRTADFDPTYPFFRYGKKSNGKQYRVIVERSDPVDIEPVFNSYGLSATASVPLIPRVA